MTEGLPPLACPRCRRLEGGELVVARLEAHPLGHACPRCGALHPTVDGVPLVLRDLDGWLAHEGATVLARRDLPAPLLERLLAGTGGPLARDHALEAACAGADEGSLATWVREVVGGLPRPAIALGCGAPHRWLDGVVGMDLRFAAARDWPGPSLVGDAADPPFLAGAFRSVLLLNLLDSVRSPRLVLGQADALLAPGGFLVIACAFAFDGRVTPPRERFDPWDLLDALRGGDRELELALGHRVLRVDDDLVWELRPSARTVHRHRVLGVVSRKAATLPDLEDPGCVDASPGAP